MHACMLSTCHVLPCRALCRPPCDVHHITSRHITSRHVMSCMHDMLALHACMLCTCHVLPCPAVPCAVPHATSITPLHVTSRYIMSCPAVPCRAVCRPPCHVHLITSHHVTS